ncbi:MAG: hypothetical protein Q9187_007479, partial [Circinaria calcarea]
MSVSQQQLVLAYRQLYRNGLHAVQYAKPARYTLKRILDQAFRNGTIEDFNALRIGNTILFLQNAAKEKGIEHKVLKNLLHVRWWEDASFTHKV